MQTDCTDITAAAANCAYILGRNSSSGTLLLGVVLDSLGVQNKGITADGTAREGTIILSDPIYYASTLTLLECLIRGYIDAGDERKHTNECFDDSRAVGISSVLCSEAVLDAVSLDKGASSSLFSVCDALVEGICARGVLAFIPTSDVTCTTNAVVDDQLTSSKAQIVVNLLLCSIYLLTGCETCGESLQSEAVAALLNKIVIMCNDDGIFSPSDLMQLHFREVLASLTSTGASFSSRQHRAFDALLRTSGGKIVGDNFDVVGPIFEAHLGCTPKVVEERSLSLMALLESAASDPSFSRGMSQSRIFSLIGDIIVPNLVWKVGGKAAALRKVSLAALFSILQAGNVKSISALAPRLFPILKSTLSDDDASSKELACHILAIMFNTTSYFLDKEAAHGICVDMTRCLEDNADSIRIAACGALAAFLAAFPPQSYFRGAAFQQLQIHSNDPCPLVRDAVVEVLLQAASIK